MTCPNCKRNLIDIKHNIWWCEVCGTIVQAFSHMVPLISRPSIVPGVHRWPTPPPPKHTSVSLDGNGNSER